MTTTTTTELATSSDDEGLSIFGNEDVVALGKQRAPVEKQVVYTPPSTGIPITLTVISAHVLWGNYLWNGARWMCDHIDAHPEEFRGKRVLELGAGAGLPSIMACKAGAQHVVVTDYPDRELIDNIQRNATSLLNAEEQTRITVKGYLWGAPIAELASPTDVEVAFDAIFLCDLLFNHSEHIKLLKTCCNTLASHGVIWCVFSHYRVGFEQRDLNFLTLAASDFGLRVEKIDERLQDFILKPDYIGNIDLQRTAFAYRISRPE